MEGAAGAGHSAPEHLFIPVLNTDEVVAVPVDQLPDEVEDLLELLQAEAAPLQLWVDFAKAYLSQNRTEQFLKMLEEGTGKEVAEYFKDARFERIQIFCALAAYHTGLGRAEKDRTRRLEHFTKASSFLNTARQIDYEEQLPHIGLGQLALAKGEPENAKREFDQAVKMRSKGRPNISGLLALASVLFNQGQHAKALTMYRQALREHPQAPAEVRLGIAACQFRLGRLGKAHAAYERVLQLDPANPQALLGLAILAFNASAGTDQGLTEGLQLVCLAYDSDPANPATLNLLAHYCILRKDYDKAERLARAAFEAADVDRIKAESLTLLARAQHAVGDQSHLQEAFRSYSLALTLDKRLALPLLGLAQLNLLQGQANNAVSLLEDALQHVPAWPDALQVLGQLYRQAPVKGQKAVKHFQEAAKKDASSAQVWEMLAELLAPTDPTGALAAYKKAIDLHRTSTSNGSLANGTAAADSHALPASLLNNAAVLHMRAGNVADAVALMSEAMQDASGVSAVSQVTMGYNMARLREASGNHKAAEAEYKAILEQFPGYLDCYLRLACIARNSGSTRRAIEWVERALEAKKDDPDALSMLAALYLERRDWVEAKSTLNALAKLPNSKHDAYTRIGLANLHFYSAPTDLRKEGNRERADNHYFHAVDAYRRVLDQDPGNIYAANGIGAVLAEQGDLDPACDIFKQVQEAGAGSEGLMRVPDVALNLANIYLSQCNYVSAIQMYTTTLRKFFNNNQPTVMLYLARAYYDSNNLVEAKRTLLAAVHCAPLDHVLRFNAALTMQEYAVRTLRQERPPGHPSKLADYERATRELVQAHRFFSQLKSMGPRRTGIEDKKLSSHIQFCSTTYTKAQAHMEKAGAEARAVEARRKEQQLKLEAVERLRAVEAEKARLLAAAQREERERQARENAARLERLKEGWREEKSVAKAVEQGDVSKLPAKKGRKGKQGGAAEPDLEELFGLDDSEEDVEYAPGMDEPAQADEGPTSPGAGTAPVSAQQDMTPGKRELLAQAGLLSDDDEEEEGEPAARPADAGPSSAQPAAPPSAGRLKRHRDTEDAETAGRTYEDLHDDAEEPSAGASAKRSRKAAILDDSDDEPAPAEALQQDGAPPVSQAEEPDTHGAAAFEDLFGSESDVEEI